jgi:hypothetical protein
MKKYTVELTEDEMKVIYTLGRDSKLGSPARAIKDKMAVELAKILESEMGGS